MDALIFKNVCKTYRKYNGPKDAFLSHIGLGQLLSVPYVDFQALDNLSFSIPKGKRVGIIGRNGAGKTTLLKLITHNFKPSSGTVEIHGTVQALMQTGLGFNENVSGMENIKASLAFNHLPLSQWASVIDDIVDFVELDDFLQKPLKTYSLGMKARLEFAVATAIHPDILIVDEVLGAGDGYFSRKSADRMHRLTKSGCTLMMVSHSTSQLQEFCDEGLWLQAGQLVMHGPVGDVLKAYESSLSLHEEQAVSSTKSIHDHLKKPITHTLLNKKLFHDNAPFGHIQCLGINKKGEPFQPGDRLSITYTPEPNHPLCKDADSFSLGFFLHGHMPITQWHQSLGQNDHPNIIVADPFLLGGGDYQVVLTLFSKGKEILQQDVGSMSVYLANDASPPLFYHPARISIQGNEVPQVIDCHYE